VWGELGIEKRYESEKIKGKNKKKKIKLVFGFLSCAFDINHSQNPVLMNVSVKVNLKDAEIKLKPKFDF